MPHPSEHSEADRALRDEEAIQLADTLKALASPTRLQVLYALSDGELTVEALTAACGLTQSATSHNLRILRSIRLVRGRRDGRNVYYSHYDHHVPDLLAAIRHHHEHLNPPPAVALPAPAKRRDSQAA